MLRNWKLKKERRIRELDPDVAYQRALQILFRRHHGNFLFEKTHLLLQQACSGDCSEGGGDDDDGDARRVLLKLFSEHTSWISPTEIEDLILHQFKDSIQEICVVGREDEVRGTVIYCAIVPRKTPEELNEKEIREYVREHLGVHFTPKRVTLFQEAVFEFLLCARIFAERCAINDCKEDLEHSSLPRVAESEAVDNLCSF
jgi:hypothetical protein